MKNRVITDADIREYLLGRLDSESELVESIDEQTLTDPKFSISVDVIEDEIIEQYLEGTLSSDDRRAVERHFLRPPERQRKLQTARLFSSYVKAESRTEQPIPARGLFRAFRIGQMLPSFRTFAEIAASVFFLVSMLNLWNQHLELALAIKQINQQLGQERERSAVANQQLQNALQLLQPAIAMLNLVRPGLQRGGQELPEVKVSSGTRTLHVEVALLSRASGKYRVQLRHTGKANWSQDGVDATPVPGGAILKLDIPAEVLTQGTGELAITPSGYGTISYWFSISKIQ
jgi:anti-sigma factor RsiW